jgi:hypothetical protein
MQAEIFDVDVAAEAGVEEQIPAGMMIVVVNVYPIAFPLPIAAAVQVVGGHDPVRIVVEDDAAGAVINTAGNKFCSYVIVAAIRISAAGSDAVVIVIPVRMRVVLIIPAPVIAVVVTIAAVVAVFVPVFALVPAFIAVVLVIVPLIAVAAVAAILPERRNRQAPGQNEQCSYQEISHLLPLQRSRAIQYYFAIAPSSGGFGYSKGWAPGSIVHFAGPACRE